MVKVWFQRDKNTAEKIKIHPDSNIDDLKEELFGTADKGKYQTTYKGQVLRPSAEVPQNTTNDMLIVFTKIGDGPTPGKSHSFISITFAALKLQSIISKRLQEVLIFCACHSV